MKDASWSGHMAASRGGEVSPTAARAAAEANRTQPFRRRTLLTVAGVGLASMVVVVVLTITGKDLAPTPTAGADSYSVSAVGHAGLYNTLRKLDIPVIASQANSADKARNGLLIVAEPMVADEAAEARLRAMLTTAPRVLLVLPKWSTQPDPTRPSWIDEVGTLPEHDLTQVLEAAGIDAVVMREASARWVAAPSVEELGLPTLPFEPQTVIADGLEGLVLDANGYMFLGYRAGAGAAEAAEDDEDDDEYAEDDDEEDDDYAEDDEDTEDAPTVSGATNELYVLSDPDVLNNHGLVRGDNAAYIVGLIDTLRQGGPVVFDETLHGYAREPSLSRLLFEFPMVLATLQGLLCVLLILWATMGRFGPPRRAAPPIGAGKAFLIRNTAALLRYGGHDLPALRRYLAASVTQVRQAFHAPRDLDEPGAVAWLERARTARGGQEDLGALMRDVSQVGPQASSAQVVALATRVHRWRTEMTHGPQ